MSISRLKVNRVEIDGEGDVWVTRHTRYQLVWVTDIRNKQRPKIEEMKTESKDEATECMVSEGIREAKEGKDYEKLKVRLEKERKRRKTAEERADEASPSPAPACRASG